MRNKILIDVPTTAIERVLEKRSILSKLLFVENRLFQHPMLKQGNWHRRSIAFTRRPVHLLLQTLLADDACEAARMNALTAHYLARGKSTQQAQQKVGKRLDHYITRCRNIAESMRRDGYVAAPGRDAINVAIAPDGTLIKVSGGNHRLSIAKLIGLPPWAPSSASLTATGCGRDRAAVPSRFRKESLRDWRNATPASFQRALRYDRPPVDAVTSTMVRDARMFIWWSISVDEQPARLRRATMRIRRFCLASPFLARSPLAAA